ncbi:MAG TPA: DUF1015 domain-containing protein [Candidatus Hydrogenedentes bacterium]|nr:DUF1015 domain-containing protein [Candidatus Hydrogenedentota bacterium]
MASVRGFRGFRFVAEKVGALDAVLTPPYDVITPAERQELIARSPCNMARLLLPVEKDGLDKYQAAAADLNAWVKAGVLEQDAQESLYLLEQAFTSPEGRRHTRRGFFAVTKLPEDDESVVLGHERTFDGPVEDRLKLTEATQANLGAIFVLYADPDGQLSDRLAPHYEREPDVQASTIDGTTQRMWRVPEVPCVPEFFLDKRLYIADGHHRFETARYHRDRMRAAERPGALRPYDFVLMGFVAFEDPGLVICPPHRLLDMPDGFDGKRFLGALDPWFDVRAAGNDLPKQVETAPGCAFGVAIDGAGNHLITLRDIDRTDLLGNCRGAAWRDLDVAVLHRGIIERILGLPESTQFTYIRDAEQALGAVASGEKGLAFLLRAVRADQVRACAEACEPMPPKSTYFFPKLPSGAVIHRLV